MDSPISSYHEIDQSASEFGKAEEKLRESEEQFRSLVSNIPGLSYRGLLDKDWTMLFISDGVETLTGYPASEFISRDRTYGSLIHPDDTALVENTVMEAIDKSEPFTIEYRIINSKNQIRWVFEKGRTIIDQDGIPRYLDGVIFDVTDRKEAETKLLESEKRFKELLNSSPSIIYSSSTERRGVYSFVSDTLLSMLGYPASTMVGDPRFWQSHVHPDDINNVINQFPPISNVTHAEIKYRFLSHSGEYRWILDTFKVHERNEYDTKELIGSWTDITEQENMLTEDQILKHLLQLSQQTDHELELEDYSKKCLKKILSKTGYHIDVANNGKEAVDMVTKSSYEIVLMDCQMPIMDGYQQPEKFDKEKRIWQTYYYNCNDSQCHNG